MQDHRGPSGRFGPTGRAMAFHAALVATIVGIKSSANALYLANYPPASLAALYIVVAVMVVLVAGLLGIVLPRAQPDRLLRRAAVILSTLVALLAVLVGVGQRWTISVLYVGAELYATTLSLLFWTTVSTWFDARSARRSFALIGSGGMAGSLVGGLFTRFAAPVLGAWGVAASMVVLTVIALPLIRHPALGSPEPNAPRQLWSGASYIIANRYPRILAAAVVAFAVVAATVDYVFRVEAAGRLDETALASLFGDLNAAIGAFAIAYQLLLTHWLLQRLGLFLFLGIIPLLLGGLSIAAALSGAFALVVVVKGVEMAGSYSIQQSAIQLLYNPIPAPYRGAVRAFVDGLMKKGGLALAGAALIALAEVAPSAISPLLVAAVAFVALILIRWLRGAYLEALEEKIRGPRVLLSPPSVEVSDRATRGLLLRTLHSPIGNEVRAALSILERDPRFVLDEHLEALLTHDDPEVRLAALSLVTPELSEALAPVLLGILSTDLRRPRAAAVRALARGRRDVYGPQLLPYLYDEDPGVSCSVIAALIDDPELGDAAAIRLTKLIGAQEPLPSSHRREVARVLGDLPLRFATAHMERLLSDDDSSVRALALESAGTLFASVTDDDRFAEIRGLIPRVQARLGDRLDRDHARDALANLGDRVVPLLRNTLDERSAPLPVRLEIPRLLRQIGTGAAAEALLFSNVRDHPSLRFRIGECLFRLRRTNPDVQIDRERTNEACLRRLEGFRVYRPVCVGLVRAEISFDLTPAAERAWRLLQGVTLDRLVQNLEMAIQLLGLHRGAERMRPVATRLVAAERRLITTGELGELAAERAVAFELLDVALEGDPLHRVVLEKLEPLPRAPGPDSDVWQLVRALYTTGDPLVSAIARHLLVATHRWEEVTAPATALLGDPTDLDQESDMSDELLTRIIALERVDLFEGLQIDDVAAIAQIAQARHAQPSEVLYREGEPGHTMLVVLNGRVLLSRGGHLLMTLHSGESLGQVSFLDRGPRPTTAVVSEDPRGADLLSIDCDVFMDLVTDRPGLSQGLFAVLGKRLRTLIDMQGGLGP